MTCLEPAPGAASVPFYMSFLGFLLWKGIHGMLFLGLVVRKGLGDFSIP